MPTVKKAFGANGFIVEQYWNGTFEYFNSAKLRRIYQANWSMCPNTIESYNKYYLTKTAYGFPMKDNLQELYDRGIDVMYASIGAFKDQTIYTDTPPIGPATNQPTGVDVGACIPINVADNPLLAASYSRLVRLLWNVARVYGNNPAGGLSTSEVSTALDNPPDATLLTGGPNNNGTGLNLIKYIEIQNEWSLAVAFGGNYTGAVKFTNESYAVCFKACYDAIKDADPNMQVIVGAFWDDGNSATLEALITPIQAIFGGTIPSDIIWNWHIYPCEPLGGNGATSKTTEQLPVPGNYYGKPSTAVGTYMHILNKWNSYGFKWMVTEFSWDTSQFSDRKVPILSGLSGTAQSQAEKSMGILDVRFTILTMCANNCIGVVKYYLADQVSDVNSTGRFGTMGIYNQNPGAIFNVIGTTKDCAVYYENFLTAMGDCNLPLQLIRFKTNDYKAVGVKNNGQKVIASWTDNTEPTYQIL